LDLQHSPGRPHRLTEGPGTASCSRRDIPNFPDIGFPAKGCGSSPLARGDLKVTFEVTYYPPGQRVRAWNPRSRDPWGFRGAHSTYTLAKANTAKQAALRAEFDVVKQQRADDRIDRTLFDDASMIRPLISSSFAMAAKPQGLPRMPIGAMRTQTS